MAIPFLNNLNLNDNQLLNAKVQVASTAPTAAKGQIYLDSTTNVNTFKYHDGSQWIGLKQLNLNNSAFINLANLSATGSNVISLEASLNATGTPDSTKYLRGDNTWSPISGIYDWSLAGDSGTTQNIISGETVTFAGGTVIDTVVGATDTLTINHASVSRTDTTSTASPSAGAAFTAVDSVTSSAEGHITALNLKTVTLPSNPTITLTGDVTGSGTTSITTTIANGAVEFAMMDPTTIITSGEGIASNDNDVTIPTSAAVKSYVDASTTGALVFQGGYDAATNTPNLDTPPIGTTIKKGFMWTVTVDGVFFAEQVRVGDSLIANTDNPTTLAGWTTVQGNTDLATLTTVGLGNVNAGTGISVSYSNGTATVSSNATSDATTISNSATISHPFSTRDVMIQLYDTVTYETVYADVSRPTTSTVTITFASTPTNPVRVLIQK